MISLPYIAPTPLCLLLVTYTLTIVWYGMVWYGMMGDE
jgi:hypothetical protein